MDMRQFAILTLYALISFQLEKPHTINKISTKRNARMLQAGYDALTRCFAIAREPQ
jgi:hypothetical protein